MESIKANFTNYHKIVEIVGKDRINERLCALHDIYQEFLEETKYIDGVDIRLNDRTLMHAIVDYFTDITRLKEFHGIEKINKDKIISYECSWILRRKPIQILKDDREDLIYINEKFVLGIFVNHLTANTIDTFDGNIILNHLCDTLLYYLKYRNCDAKILEMFILFFKGGNSIPKIHYK